MSLVRASLAVFDAVLLSLVGIGQTVSSPGTVMVPGTVWSVGVYSSSITLSPPPGHYTTAQTVSISGPGGTTCFYTTDGSSPNIASVPYTAPFLISASKVVTVECAQLIVSYTNGPSASSDWKCLTETGGTYGSLVCPSSGGVAGTISNATMTFGSQAVLTASTTMSSPIENQILFVYTNTGAGGLATMLAEDKIFAPSQGSSYIANNEVDMNLNDTTQSPDRYHGFGLQCNQQPGNDQWQISDQQGSWHSTGITDSCPIAANQYIEIRYSGHWTQPDTGCGGYGCDNYDILTVCPGTVTGGVFTSTSCTDHALSAVYESYTEPTWAAVVELNEQIDLTNITQSGANPTTAARSILQENIAAGVYSTFVKTTGTYTIP